MRLKSVTIKDFRRFTDLKVTSIPPEAKLVILAGPNGSGKSSFFDALHVWHHQQSRRGIHWEDDYHRKTATRAVPNWAGDEILAAFHGEVSADLEGWKRSFYIRSAYRNEADFSVHQIGRMGDPLDVYPVSRMIDDDRSVSRNYQRLVSEGIEDLYIRADGQTTFEEYREQAVNKIGVQLQRVLPHISLNGLGNPFDNGTFRFSKGTSQRFPYKNLSGGEKAAFDLIADLILAIRNFHDTIFCIDEPESHMNTRVQGDLLSVLYEIVPDNCQLILATHSIGMMRRARDLWRDDPHAVAFLDFGGQDFDESVTIEPSIPNRAFWQRQHDVALDDLASLLAPDRVVICEGAPGPLEPGKNHSFDAQCYERILDAEFADTRFVSMGNDRQIIGDQRGLAQALVSLVKGLEVIRLVDRDERTDEEVGELVQDGVRVLSRRSIESYLLDDEVLTALCVHVGQSEKAVELLEKKQEIVGANFDPVLGKIKPHAGRIFEACKTVLSLDSPGSGKIAFMRDTLAPLIRPGMAVYEELRRDIFGE